AAVDVEINGHARARANLMLDTETRRPRAFVLEVGRDLLNAASRQHRSRREARQRVRERREERIAGVERQRHQAVTAADASLHDREDRVLLRKPAKAAAHDPLLIAFRIPGKPEPWVEV